MPEWPDPRAVSFGIAFGSNEYDDPTGLSFTQVAPDPDDADDPGHVLQAARIARGRIGDAAQTDRTLIEFGLRDEGGKFSPRNATGEHYGQLRRGTWVQVALDGGFGPQPLATAAVPSWSPTRDGPGIDERMPIRALGILNRISRDTTTLPPVRRAVEASAPIAYWPLEDGVDATSAGAATSGVSPMVTGGVVEFGSDDTLPGSLGTPDLTAGALFGTAPLGGSATAWHVEFWFLADFNAGATAAYIPVDSSGIATWRIRQPATANGNIDVLVHDSAGALIDTISAPVTGWTANTWHHVAVCATQSGGNVAVTVYGDGSLLASDSISTVTLGRALGFSANDYAAGVYAELNSCAHIAIGDGVTPSSSATAGNAHIGETAADRVNRILTELGITGAAFTGDSAVMGAQPAASTLQILRECEAADDGVLYEGRDGQLFFQLTESRYNSTAVATFAFGTDDDPADITDLISFDDDRDLYNIVEVAQPDGTFAVAELRDGPVGSDTTTGVGPRRMPRQVRNIYLAGDVRHHAGWLLRRTTIDLPRYVVVIDFFANRPDLAYAVPLLDIGNRIRITGVDPDHEGPDTLDLVIEGEVIDFDAARLMVAWYCEPYEPWRVQQLADTPPASNAWDGWLTPTSMTVDGSDFDAGTDTSMAVAVTPAITTNAGVMPLRIKALGWVGEVTAVGAPSAGVQTLTVTQEPLNGVHKTIPAGTAVELADPLIPAL